MSHSLLITATIWAATAIYQFHGVEMLAESSMASNKVYRHSILYSIVYEVFVECFDGCLMLDSQYKFGMSMRIAIPFGLSQCFNLGVDSSFDKGLWHVTGQ